MSRSKSLVAGLLLWSCLVVAPSLAATTDTAGRWVGTWATSTYAGEAGRGQSSDVTLRQIAHISIGGRQLRVRFTNEHGTLPLRIGAASVALAGNGGAIQPGSDRPLTFDGRESATIAIGAVLLSDPVEFNVPAAADLAISLYLPLQEIGTLTQHGDPRQTHYMVSGNAVRSANLQQPTTQTSSQFLSGIDVLADRKARAIVALGDSITDGAASTRDTNRRWPDFLARRFAADKRTANVGVLNQGISGNRLLNPYTAEAALARFDSDVLAQSGVSHVIVLIGINDIGRWGRPHILADEVSKEDIIAGLKQLITRAHAHDIKVIGATLTPYEGAAYFSSRGEAIRQGVNQWIRESNAFDGVADFDAATRDTQQPSRFSSATDSGDHLHPNDAGMEAMANAINLDLFK